MSFFKSVVPYSPSRLFITNFKIQTQHFVLCLLISVFCLLYLPCTAVAGTEAVTVGWDASPSAVAGYEFCYGTSSGSYDHVVDVGNHTSCSISGLEAGTTYYFAVKAYTAEGLSSELSVELAYTVPVKNLIASPDFATIYEDAEDGTTRGWAVYDKSPAGASIKNVYDSGRNSRVIQLSGSGVDNGYRLRNSDGSKWHNAEQFILQWSMKYSESFVIYIDVETTAGHRYLRYKPIDRDYLGGGEYVDFGIGSDAVDGSWHTFVRDLQADLEDAQPGNKILEVNGFLIRGSGMVDDIKLGDISYGTTPENIPIPSGGTTYEDAEDGTTKGWAIYDKSPAGASIKNVYDSGRNSRVIQLSGSGVDNGYRLRNSDGSKWQNAEQFILQWSMKYSESFVIYIDVETTAGHRYLRYTPVDYDNLTVAKTYADFGIGSDAVDGSWHTFVRDLQADIEAAFPGTTILEVNGFLIRGSGMVDDIMLY